MWTIVVSPPVHLSICHHHNTACPCLPLPDDDYDDEEEEEEEEEKGEEEEFEQGDVCWFPYTEQQEWEHILQTSKDLLVKSRHSMHVSLLESGATVFSILFVSFQIDKINMTYIHISILRVEVVALMFPVYFHCLWW